MNFALFLILNALLLIRPEELVPALAGARLYLITIIACVFTTLPGITARLTPDALRDRPIAVCVLGLWAAGFVSLLAFRFRLSEATDFVGEFGKVVLYFFLLISVVDTPGKFRALVGWLVGCVAVNSGLAVLDLQEVIDIPTINHVSQGDETAEGVRIVRLCSTGIFGDPNDLSLVLSFAIIACVYLAISGHTVLRFGWLLPVAILFFAMTLTHSRGGLLGLFAGVGAWLFARYGGTRSVPLAVVAVAGLLALVGGRQGGIGGGGTAHERLVLWGSGLGELFRMPMYLPVGLGLGYYVDEYGLVAHNSFINAYVETGVVGGGFFVAAFYIAARVSDSVGRASQIDWVRTARPFVFAIVAAYAVGCFSISRQHGLPTFVVLGLASAYLELAVGHLPDRYRVSRRWCLRIALLGVAGLIGLKFVTQGLGVLGV